MVTVKDFAQTVLEEDVLLISAVSGEEEASNLKASWLEFILPLLAMLPCFQKIAPEDAKAFIESHPRLVRSAAIHEMMRNREKGTKRREVVAAYDRMLDTMIATPAEAVAEVVADARAYKVG